MQIKVMQAHEEASGPLAFHVLRLAKVPKTRSMRMSIFYIVPLVFENPDAVYAEASHRLWGWCALFCSVEHKLP